MQNGNFVLVEAASPGPVPLVSVVNCRTCQSPHRLEVERALAQGTTYAAIAAHLAYTGLSARNIAEHFRRRHMPIGAAAVRQIAEERAAQLNVNVSDSASSLVDRVVLLKAIVQRVFERLAVGDIEPDVRDGIRAATVLAAIEPRDLRTDEREFVKHANRTLIRTVGSVVTPEQWERILVQLRADPVVGPILADDTLDVSDMSDMDEFARCPAGAFDDGSADADEARLGAEPISSSASSAMAADQPHESRVHHS